MLSLQFYGPRRPDNCKVGPKVDLKITILLGLLSLNFYRLMVLSFSA